MSKQNQSVESQSKKQDRQKKATPDSARQPEGLPGAEYLPPDRFLTALVDDGRFPGVQRQRMAARLVRVGGNRQAQGLFSRDRAGEPALTAAGSAASGGLVQRALPNIPQPDAPNLAGMPQAQIQSYIRLLQAYRASHAPADGQSLIDAVSAALPGSVNYNAPDITPESPAFLDGPSEEADRESVRNTGQPVDRSTVAGFTYAFQTTPTVLYKVEIYPKVFLPDDPEATVISFLIGTLVHEYIHVEQNRREVGGGAGASERFTGPHREFQAWMWQAEHVDEMGIAPGTPSFNQIISNVTRAFDDLPSQDQNQLRARYSSVRYRALYYQCERLAGFNMRPPAGSVTGLTEAFTHMSPADRSAHQAEYSELMARINALPAT